MKTQKIEKLKKGEYFKKLGQNQVLIFNGYCRINKRYEYQKFDDISAFGYIKKGKEVAIGFEF
jgi:hypothetical protein